MSTADFCLHRGGLHPGVHLLLHRQDRGTDPVHDGQGYRGSDPSNQPVLLDHEHLYPAQAL